MLSEISSVIAHNTFCFRRHGCISLNCRSQQTQCMDHQQTFAARMYDLRWLWPHVWCARARCSVCWTNDLGFERQNCGRARSTVFAFEWPICATHESRSLSIRWSADTRRHTSHPAAESLTALKWYNHNSPPASSALLCYSQLFIIFLLFFMFHVTANKSIEQTNQSALCLLEIYIIIGLILRQKDTQQNTIMELVKLNHQNSFNAKHQNGLQLDSDYVVSTTTTTTTAMCIVLVINGSSSSSSSFCYHAFWTKHLAACCIETYHFINDAMEMEWKLFFVFFFCSMMRPSAMTKLWAIIIVYREKQCQLFACLFVY